MITPYQRVYALLCNEPDLALQMIKESFAEANDLEELLDRIVQRMTVEERATELAWIISDANELAELDKEASTLENVYLVTYKASNWYVLATHRQVIRFLDNLPKDKRMWVSVRKVDTTSLDEITNVHMLD